MASEIPLFWLQEINGCKSTPHGVDASSLQVALSIFIRCLSDNLPVGKYSTQYLLNMFNLTHTSGLTKRKTIQSD